MQQALNYAPDHWMIIKVSLERGVHYRILGVWSGSYLKGEHWRLNSGVKSVEEKDTCYKFKGASGSTYTCMKDSYGTNAFGLSVIKDLQATYPGVFEPIYLYDVKEVLTFPFNGDGLDEQGTSG